MNVPASKALMALANTILRTPATPPPAIAYYSLVLAQVAWNKCAGVEPSKEAHDKLAIFEKANKQVYEYFTVSSTSEAIEQLVNTKTRLYPGDYRVIESITFTPEGLLRAYYRKVPST